MRIVLLFFIALFMGCSDELEISYNDDAYENELSKMLNDREIFGKVFFPKAFIPKTVKVFELDSNFEKNKELKVAFDSSLKVYKIESQDYANRYLFIEASGLWKNYDSIGIDVNFELITNIAVVSDSIELNLFSHLEIPRVKLLMKEGYPFLAAKRKAMHELFLLYRDESLYWESDFRAQVSERFSHRMEIERRMGIITIQFFPYLLFLYGGTDSAFVKNIEKFRNDFANGVWQDSVERIKSADYLLKNYYSLYQTMKNWNPDQEQLYFLDCFLSVLSMPYDLPRCSVNGQTFKIATPLSKFYNDSVVCEELVKVEYWNNRRYVDSKGFLMRLFTNLEKQLGICVYDSAAKPVIKEYDGFKYVCNHPGKTFIPDSSKVENWKRKE